MYHVRLPTFKDAKAVPSHELHQQITLDVIWIWIWIWSDTEQAAAVDDAQWIATQLNS